MGSAGVLGSDEERQPCAYHPLLPGAVSPVSAVLPDQFFYTTA